jgi:hypothetical protein
MLTKLQNGVRPVSKLCAVHLAGIKPYLKDVNWETARETAPLELTRLQSRPAAEHSLLARPRGVASRSSRVVTGLEKADVTRTTAPSKSIDVPNQVLRPTNVSSSDVQLARSERGDGKWGCNLGGRKKSLCCNAPSGVEPYTPVPLESLFPEVPPEDSTIRYDLQILGGFTGSGAETTHDDTHNDPSFAPFGFVLVAGPKGAVSSISKRDNSHVEVVDCSEITSSGSQLVRIFCSNDSKESNCDDMLGGGLEGTVIRMPDNCGPATYVVAQSLTVPKDQSLPRKLSKRKPLRSRY